MIIQLSTQQSEKVSSLNTVKCSIQMFGNASYARFYQDASHNVTIHCPPLMRTTDKIKH